MSPSKSSRSPRAVVMPVRLARRAVIEADHARAGIQQDLGERCGTRAGFEHCLAVEVARLPAGVVPEGVEREVDSRDADDRCGGELAPLRAEVARIVLGGDEAGYSAKVRIPRASSPVDQHARADLACTDYLCLESKASRAELKKQLTLHGACLQRTLTALGRRGSVAGQASCRERV